MFRISSLFNLLFDTCLVLVQTAFQDDDRTTHYYDNHQDAFGLVHVANADEWAVETDAGAALLATRTGAGQYEIEMAEQGLCIQRCYACDRLYIERRDYVDSLIKRGSYDPTDYACGCTWRWLEAQAEAVASVQPQRVAIATRTYAKRWSSRFCGFRYAAFPRLRGSV